MYAYPHIEPVQAVRWNGVNDSELQELCGDAFLEIRGDAALVKIDTGVIVHVRPLWYVTRWSNGIVVLSDDAYKIIFQ